tara:strand:+ start:540 stop:1658 length:1119 start_codon:yes stop_codon:yes gene_type:complete
MSALAQTKTDQSTTPTPSPKHHQNLAYSDFFVGVNQHDIYSDEFKTLKPKVQMCYVYLSGFIQQEDRFKQNHTYQGRSYNLPDGTLWANSGLKPKLAEALGVSEETVRGYLKDLADAGFLQHDPKWKRIGNSIRYQIVRLQDKEVTAEYLKKIHKAPIKEEKTLDIAEQIEQNRATEQFSLVLDTKSNTNSSSSLKTSESQLPLPGSEIESPEPINPYFKISQLWKEKTKMVPRGGGPAFVVDFLTRFNLSEVQAEKVLLRAIPNFDGHHPDGNLVNHITWIANDTRSYDGTTGDWLRKEIEVEGGKIPQAKTKPDNSTATANQLTQSEKEQYQAERVREREKSRATFEKMASKTLPPKDFNPIPYFLREDQ